MVTPFTSFGTLRTSCREYLRIHGLPVGLANVFLPTGSMMRGPYAAECGRCGWKGEPAPILDMAKAYAENHFLISHFDDKLCRHGTFHHHGTLDPAFPEKFCAEAVP